MPAWNLAMSYMRKLKSETCNNPGWPHMYTRHKRISYVATLTEIEGRTCCAETSAAAETTPSSGRLVPTAPTPREVSRLTPRGQLPRPEGDVIRGATPTVKYVQAGRWPPELSFSSLIVRD